MSTKSAVAEHYGRGDLLTRLSAALIDDGVDPHHPSFESLAPYDHFHGRGLEATRDLADRLTIAPTDRVLDIGCGIGGPARYVAHRFGCQVTGIDLTAEFCEAARHLTRLLGLDGNVVIEQGDALAMPFADASFDGAYSMNVSMNIADKTTFYREIHRVLRPGGWLALSELARGPGGEIDFPTPWAKTAATSFLASPQSIRAGLGASGFEAVTMHDTTDQARDFGARARAMVERGEKPPHRAIQLIHGDIAPQAAANLTRGIAEGCVVPIEIMCRKPPLD